MALSISQANAVSTKYFDTTLKQIVWESSPFWMKMKKSHKMETRGGNSIQFPIRYKKLGIADAGDFDDQLTYKSIETRSGGELSWKTYNTRTLITKEEQIKNTGEPEIISLIKDKSAELKEDMDDRFATDLFTENPNGKGFTSLDTIVDSSASYAGISISDMSAWVGWEDASTTGLAIYGPGSLSYYVNQATFGKDSPSMMLTTKNLYTRFMAIYEGQKVVDKDMAEAGFSNNLVAFGSTIMPDAYVPASTWYGLDIDQFKFRVHPDDNMHVTDWFTLEQIGLPDHMAKVISWTGNLCCRSRRSSFKMTNLNWQL
jgi:hypothetical protein